ncbi:hypothetical protein C8R46DRAFT_1071106 [Mycena filopes]|nr:hypothetical protein C8R46DRAFT_1071106 [Mycena filopes]
MTPLATIHLIDTVNYLGLPKPKAVPTKSRASALSINTLKKLGWEILFDEGAAHPDSVQDLWSEGLEDKAAKAIRSQDMGSNAKIIEHLREIRGLYLDQTKIPCIPVSREYELEDGSLNLVDSNYRQNTTDLLRVCLYCVVRELPKAVSFVGPQPGGASAYPAVEYNFADLDSEKDLDVHNRRIAEPTLVSLLRLGGFDKEDPDEPDKPTSYKLVSELAVERTVGAALRDIFHGAEEVELLSSGEKIAAPQALGPTDSFPYPDLAALRIAGTDRNQAQRIQPVVIVGEAKARQRGLKSDAEAARSKTSSQGRANARAQMAAAVHPTLILLVIAHYLRDQSLDIKQLATQKKFPQFDEKSIVFGIYYDQAEVRIYAHFPQVVNEDGSYRIKFYQVAVGSFLLPTSLATRWRMTATLFCIQKHANMISNVLGDIIPKLTNTVPA